MAVMLPVVCGKARSTIKPAAAGCRRRRLTDPHRNRRVSQQHDAAPCNQTCCCSSDSSINADSETCNVSLRKKGDHRDADSTFIPRTRRGSRPSSNDCRRHVRLTKAKLAHEPTFVESCWTWMQRVMMAVVTAGRQVNPSTPQKSKQQRGGKTMLAPRRQEACAVMAASRAAQAASSRARTPAAGIVPVAGSQGC